MSSRIVCGGLFSVATTSSPGRTSIIGGSIRQWSSCGFSAARGRSEVRNAVMLWIEDRIRLLADSFAVSVYSYAVMSNHAHIVLFVDPDEASGMAR